MHRFVYVRLDQTVAYRPLRRGLDRESVVDTPLSKLNVNLEPDMDSCAVVHHCRSGGSCRSIGGAHGVVCGSALGVHHLAVYSYCTGFCDREVELNRFQSICDGR